MYKKSPQKKGPTYMNNEKIHSDVLFGKSSCPKNLKSFRFKPF